MTRLLSSAFLALTLGLGGMAAAQDSQLQIGARTILEQHGYEGIDVGMLSTEQLALFETQFVGGDTVDNAAIAQNMIDEILLMEEETSAFVSPRMQAMFGDTNELVANARTLLDQAGFAEVDASTLSTRQLAQLWFVQERDEVVNNPAMLQSYIANSVLDAS